MKRNESAPQKNVANVVSKKRKKRRRGNLRTVILAITAAITFVWASISVWEVSADEMLSFFLMSVALVAVVVVLAGVLAVLKRLLGKLFDR
ncbi:hypothetical protein SIN8267_00721 [Sinobacterium norvegicum]|uniref:DUF1049 domain-containing protein n=1 Tax=Sinobacterium norvegicum TaxID=1641715 RepID=A0ABM9ABP7_9GAMM|nr:hypothetical protein [Sinobacterium norvegicum]CAH0990627.1 hypothetical protein SIN8267_00721 [Sinobacterium norvegicum]